MSAKLIKRLLIGTAVAVFWIGVWWLIALYVNKELLVPTPYRVLQACGDILRSDTFWRTVGASLQRIVYGFLAAVAVGTVLALLTVKLPPIKVLFAPLLHLVRAAPVASFIILTMVWIVTDRVPTFISFLMVLPIVWVNMEEGFRRIDPQLKEMAVVYRLGPWRTLTKVTLPSVMPFFLTACTNGLGFAWKSGVAAEVICRPEFSIGNKLYEAKTYLEMPEMFAWTAVVVLLSILLEQLLLRLTKRLTPAYRKEGAHADTE